MVRSPKILSRLTAPRAGRRPARAAGETVPMLDTYSRAAPRAVATAGGPPAVTTMFSFAQVGANETPPRRVSASSVNP